MCPLEYGVITLSLIFEDSVCRKLRQAPLNRSRSISMVIELSFASGPTKCEFGSLTQFVLV